MESQRNTNSSDKILSIATRIAQAHGYGGLSVRRLAEEVGVKPASLYHHFPSKAALAAAVARRYWEKFVDAIGRTVESASGPHRLLAQISQYVQEGAGERQPHLPVQFHDG